MSTKNNQSIINTLSSNLSTRNILSSMNNLYSMNNLNTRTAFFPSLTVNGKTQMQISCEDYKKERKPCLSLL